MIFVADTVWQDYRNEITAAATVVLAFGLAQLVDRTLSKRGRRLGTAMGRGELSVAADTRLRLVRRLIYATIIVLGVALALSQFEGIKRVATGILASSAVLGLVVGFAARQTLANAVAGILLAITQPVRIGDVVEFEGLSGTVEDVRLTYTYVRGGDGRRIIIPNERLASSTIQNHTIVDARVHVEVSLWIPLEADVQRAVQVLEELEEVDALVAEAAKDGVRVVAGTWAPSAAEKGSVEARVRADALERLRDEGLFSTTTDPP